MALPPPNFGGGSNLPPPFQSGDNKASPFLPQPPPRPAFTEQHTHDRPYNNGREYHEGMPPGQPESNPQNFRPSRPRYNQPRQQRPPRQMNWNPTGVGGGRGQNRFNPYPQNYPQSLPQQFGPQRFQRGQSNYGPRNGGHRGPRGFRPPHQSAGVQAYYKPNMLEDPWAHLP